MKSLLEQVKKLDWLIRQLQKLASRIRAGENVDAYRECHNIIGALTKDREDLIASSSGEEDAE